MSNQPFPDHAIEDAYNDGYADAIGRWPMSLSFDDPEANESYKKGYLRGEKMARDMFEDANEGYC